MSSIRVTVWNEGRHEKVHPAVTKIYPDGMHSVIAGHLREQGMTARTATFGPSIELPASEMYGEPFDIPNPDALIFVSWFQGGEVFRGGACFQRSRGRSFYFSPGHETYPIYYNKDVLRVITNAVRWAAPIDGAYIPAERHHIVPLEPITKKD